jgi:hypothetical protein
MTGTQKEVIGIGQDDAGLEVIEEVVLVESLDGCLGADWHKYGRRDIAMFGVQDACAGTSLGAFGEEFEGDLARQDRLYCAGVVSAK